MRRIAVQWALAAALAFGVIFAALTAAVHFVGLTTGRQSGEWSLVWPSVAYAVELLAWDVFLGLALICAAPALGPGRLANRAKWVLVLAGALCLLGTIGPLAGDMALQRVGIVGYGLVLPVGWALLAGVLRTAAKNDRGESVRS